MPQNKVEKSGVFLTPAQEQFSHHVSPHISPRSHHQKTTFKHPLFPKPPQKRQQKRKNSTPLRAQNFFSKNEPKHSAQEPAPPAAAPQAP
jgi:hypothetical protein